MAENTLLDRLDGIEARFQEVSTRSIGSFTYTVRNSPLSLGI